MTNKIKDLFTKAFIAFVFFFMFLILGIKIAINNAFGCVTIGAIAVILQFPLTGTNSNTVYSLLLNSLLYTFMFFVPIILSCYWKPHHSIILVVKDKTKITLLPVKQRVIAFISLLLVVVCCFSTIKEFCLTINHYNRPNELLRNFYTSPKSVKLSFPQKKRNLIFIVVESLESTFFQKIHDGAMDKDVIPELYNLANDNICFSVNENCLGMKPTRDHWTIAAIVAQTSGVPFVIPWKGNNYFAKVKFLPGITNIFDILHVNGYKQAFICGSDVRFAGRDNYLKTHHVDFIYDLGTARKEHFIPTDYHDGFWGMEDKKMFEFAKKKLTEISNFSSPFACTILTVDTHFPEGNFRENCCKHQFDENYLNVYACTSRRINAFVEWLKTQPFYANTTIVITGDHPTMCQGSVPKLVPKDYKRHIYNCFINSPIKPLKEKNRDFTLYDIFPTILASLGCKIQGDRIALGTNLFSEKPTLYEELGEEVFWKKFGTGNSHDYNELFLLNLHKKQTQYGK